MKFDAAEVIEFTDPTKMSRDELRALQWRRLKRQLAYNYANAPFHRERLDAAGLHPEDIRTWDDFLKVPVMNKSDHRGAQEESITRFGHPFGMLGCAPLEKFVLIAATSGTSGLPTFYTLTDRDLKIFSELQARKYRRMGLRPGDRVLHAFALSMMVGGVPFLQTLRSYGACIVPVGAEVGSQRLLEFARLTRPRMLVCTPSYAEYIADKCFDVLGIPARDLGIEIILCGGEPGASLPDLRQKIESAYGGRLYDYTGLIHTFHGISCGAPGVGMHFISEDYCVLEILDQETKRPLELKEGVVGEMVYTYLDIEGSPLMRYALGDVLEISTAPCTCGWTGLSFKILGRSDDMLIVKGVNVYPAAIRNVVAGFVPRTTGQIRVILDRPGHKVTPPLNLVVEHGAEVEQNQLRALASELENRIHDKLKVRPKIDLVEPGTLQRSTYKTKLVEVLSSKGTADSQAA